MSTVKTENIILSKWYQKHQKSWLTRHYVTGLYAYIMFTIFKTSQSIGNSLTKNSAYKIALVPTKNTITLEQSNLEGKNFLRSKIFYFANAVNL